MFARRLNIPALHRLGNIGVGGKIPFFVDLHARKDGLQQFHEPGFEELDIMTLLCARVANKIVI
jgi:hypothetical protein